jgi:hypothetical protein
VHHPLLPRLGHAVGSSLSPADKQLPRWREEQDEAVMSLGPTPPPRAPRPEAPADPRGGVHVAAPGRVGSSSAPVLARGPSQAKQESPSSPARRPRPRRLRQRVQRLFGRALPDGGEASLSRYSLPVRMRQGGHGNIGGWVRAGWLRKN